MLSLEVKKTVASFLRHNAGLHSRKSNGIDQVSVREARDVLDSKRYRKACEKTPLLAKITTGNNSMDILLSLQSSDLIVRVGDELVTGAWYQRLSPRPVEPSKWVPLGGEDYFTWPSPPKPSLIKSLARIVYLCCLYWLFLLRELVKDMSWKIFCRSKEELYSWLGALTVPSPLTVILFLVASPFVVVVGRVILFTVTHLFYHQGLWLFPRLLNDNTFLGPFWPLYSWDTEPKKPLGQHWRRFKNSIREEIGFIKHRQDKYARRRRRNNIH